MRKHVYIISEKQRLRSASAFARFDFFVRCQEGMNNTQRYIQNSKTVAEKGVTYLSLTWSHNPECSFSYDGANVSKSL